jgi:phage-related protein
MTEIPILNLPPVKWQISSEVNNTSVSIKLGDGYSVNSNAPNSIRHSYSITIPALSTSSKDNIVAVLKQYQGVTKFRWRPIEQMQYRVFVCDRFSATAQGTNVWEVTANFIEQK